MNDPTPNGPVFSLSCSKLMVRCSEQLLARSNAFAFGLVLFATSHVWTPMAQCLEHPRQLGQDSPSSSQPESEDDDAVPEDLVPEDLRTRITGDDWPIFLGPSRDNKSAETGIATNWTDDRLKVVWSRELKESYGIGSTSLGRYFQMDREGDQAVLLCLNAETGEELWRHETPTDYLDLYGYNGGPRCSPVVDGNRVYVYGVDGILSCIRVEDGEPIWSVDTVEEYGVVQNFFGVGSTPIVFEELLIVMVGGSAPEFQRLPPGRLDRVEGEDSGFVAFDKRTGEEVYRCTNELASYASMQLATINEKPIALGFARGGLVSFSPQDGTILGKYPWRARSLESVNASTPIVIGDRVLISETYGPGTAVVRATDDGLEEVWSDDPTGRERSLQTHWNTPIFHEGYVYGSSGRHTENAELRCIDIETGEVQWSQPRTSRCSLLYVDGHFVVLGEYGAFYLIRATPEAFDPITQVPIVIEDESSPTGQREALNYPAWAAPILSHGLMYVRGEDYLVCLELIPE